MNIGILNYTGSAGHLGCFAAMYALEGELSQRYGEDAHIERISCTTEGGPQSECSSEDDFDELVAEFEDGHSLASKLDSFDLLIMNGEGTLHWPCPNRRVWMWLALIELFKKRFPDRPVWVINSSLFSSDPMFLGCVARVFGKADHLAIRDPLSQATVRNAGLGHAVQSADLTFLTRATLTDPVTDEIASRYSRYLNPKTGRTIIIAGSSALSDDGQIAWLDCCSTVIEQLRDSCPALHAIFIAQRGMARDIKLGQNLTRQVPNVQLLTEDLTPAEAVWLISRAAVVLSGRFHVNTFAIRSNTPALMLPGNTPKNEGLARLADSARYRSFALDDVAEMTDAGRAILAQAGRSNDSPADKAYHLARKNFPSVQGTPDVSDDVDWDEYIRQIRFGNFLCEWENAGRIKKLECHLENARKTQEEFADICNSRAYRCARKVSRLFRRGTAPRSGNQETR